MAKLKEDAIKQSDMVEFLNTASDFSFELRVQQLLMDSGFKCSHGGNYEDPVTKKTRQFDIRAWDVSKTNSIGLAVECKNLRSSYPLLISTVPRTSNESYYCVLCSHKRGLNQRDRDPLMVAAMYPHGTSVSIDGTDSGLYPEQRPVGKSCNQVGRDSNGNFATGDAEIYEKWGQAIASAGDLVELAYAANEKSKTKVFSSIIFPLVVVPDSRLWVAHYNENGVLQGDPVQTDSCSYFVNKSYECEKMTGFTYQISHIEFVTISGLKSFITFLKTERARLFDETIIAEGLSIKAD